MTDCTYEAIEKVAFATAVHDVVAATCELRLIPARVQSIAPRMRAIDSFSCLRHQPIRVLANQNA